MDNPKNRKPHLQFGCDKGLADIFNKHAREKGMRKVQPPKKGPRKPFADW